MAEKNPPRSEADELQSFLAELERGSHVREIAGWKTGFAALDRALNGISPGLYLLVGSPACGKTALAKQLLDQIARLNSVPALFFTFAEKKNDLRIRTFARLSGLEGREIRRGAGYLLHTYGVAKHAVTEAAEMSPGWEKLKCAAEEAKSWLDRVYIYECDQNTTLNDIEALIRDLAERTKDATMVVIDDAQRLGASGLALDARLSPIVEKLHDLTLRLNLPLLATWPDLEPGATPQRWAEKIIGADVVMVMREDAERTKRLSEPNQAIALHIVKNRAGEKAALRFDFSPALAKFSEARD